MDSAPRLDVLLVAQDPAVREVLANELATQLSNALVKRASSAADAINSHRVAWFDLIVIHGVQLGDCDCWRLLSMIRSGDFGFRDTPAFVLVPSERQDAFAPLCDGRTTLIAADSSQEAVARIAGLQGSAPLPTLLLVEDELRAATATARGLRKHFEVDVCHDGPSALSLWNRKAHQLIVLDLMLPGMMGDEVLRHVIAESPQQAVIFLTAHNNPERHVELVLAGARTCISKPVRPHDFANVCARVLSQDHSLRAAASAGTITSVAEHLSDCVYAAQRTLSAGRAGEAMGHLQKALAAALPKTAEEDEWDVL